MVSIVKNIKKNPANKDKTNVIFFDYVDLVKNAFHDEGNQFLITEGQFNTLLNSQDKKDEPRVQLIMTLNPETYYANLESPTMNPLMEKNAVQTLPALNASSTRENLTGQKGLKFVENAIKAGVTAEAVEKAIQVTSQKDGAYPDKAIDILKGTRNYFSDKEQITEADVETYLAETKSLSETQTDSSDIDICFDTGKRLDDIVGSPMTKADAQNIVDRILNGSITTQGFNAYLENGTSYGGGRRHTAEAIAGEAKIPMITINAKDFALKDIDAISQNANYSEMKIKKIVSAAKAQAEANKNKTAMIFIENFDNFAANPLYGFSSIYEQKAFSQLLDEMKKTREEGNVNLVVVGSVNTPEIIDPNVLKPYKFLNSIIVYPPQDKFQRKDVLNYYAKKSELKIEGKTEQERDDVLTRAAETTQGFTVIDLMYLIETAKSVAHERNKETIGKAEFTEAYLQTTTDRVNTVKMDDFERRLITSHETGHALNIRIMGEIAKKQGKPWRLPENINFITLDPRGMYGGAVYSKSSENDQYSFEKMFSELVFSYGGYSSEMNLYDMPGSYRISADIESVTEDTKLMVLDMGMGPNTGVAKVNRDPNGNLEVSESKMAAIEYDIEVFQNAAKEVSNAINYAYHDFIVKFTENHYRSAGTGDCIIPSEQFVKELNEWRSKLPKEKKLELLKLETKILKAMEKAKAGKQVAPFRVNM